MEAALSRVDDATALALSHMSSLSLRIDLLDEVTLPVRERTRTLTKAQSNITTTMSKLERISSFFLVARDVEPILTRCESGDMNVVEVIAALYRISDSIAYLNDHKGFLSTGAYVERLALLQTKARDSCLDEFERLVRSSRSSPSEAPRNEISDDAVESATTIRECLLATGDMRPIETYGAARSEAMRTALREFAEMDAMTRWLPAEPYVAGSHKWLDMSTAIIASLRVEVDLFRRLMPQDESSGARAFGAACLSSIEQFCKAGKLSTEALFASPARVGVEGEGFTVVLDLFSRFSSNHAELDELVRPMGEASNELSRLLEDLKLHLRSAVMAALITLVNGIRHDRSDIADSGTVSVLTSDTARAVRRLARYKHAYCQFVGEQNTHAGTKPVSIFGDVGRALEASDGIVERVIAEKVKTGTEVDNFIALILDVLLEVLDGKRAKLPRSSTTTRMGQASVEARGHLFMANNASYIIKVMDDKLKGAAESLLQAVDCVKRRYESAIDAFTSSGWSLLLEHVAVIDGESLQYTKGKLTFESGRVLKSRFQSFWGEFDELLSLVHGWVVVNGSVRTTLRKRLITMLAPAVRLFFEKYGSEDFSKSKQEAYLRGGVEEVLRELGGLF